MYSPRTSSNPKDKRVPHQKTTLTDQKLLKTQLCPALHKLLLPLYKSVNVTNPFPSDNKFSGNLCTRFSAKIEFCRQYISVDVLFSDADCKTLPELIFATEHNDFCNHLFSEDLTIFGKWNKNDDARLENMMNIIRKAYTDYNTQKMIDLQTKTNHVNLKFEIDTVFINPDFEMAQTLEIYTHPSSLMGYDQIDMKFLLPIDWGLLPEHIQPPSTVNAYAKLYLTFKIHSLEPLDVSHTLEVPHSLLKDIEVRPWTPDTCLMEYLPQIQNLIKRTLTRKLDQYTWRRLFVASALSIFGPALCEYDQLDFTHIQFCVSACGWIIFSIVLKEYPKQKPILKLTSLQPQVEDFSGCFSVTYDDYPYDVKWAPEQLLHEIRSFITEELPNFKQALKSNIE